MTHFLARLVERARGTGPRVEPIVAPRFAPSPFAEIASEVEPFPRSPEIASKVEVSPLARPETRGPETPVKASEPFVRGEKTPAGTPKAAELIESAAQAVPEPLLVTSHPPDNEVARPPADARENGRPGRDGLLAVQLIPQVVRQGNPTHQRRATFRSSVRPDRSGESLAEGKEPASNDRPIARVTIGRIEVRAEPAPAPPPRKTTPHSVPKLTLDAYLKARKEGAR
jgi:hypothetical protein